MTLDTQVENLDIKGFLLGKQCDVSHPLGRNCSGGRCGHVALRHAVSQGKEQRWSISMCKTRHLSSHGIVAMFIFVMLSRLGG
jgi:hypothetical protein